ncbi:hypothetical protein ACFWZY_26135 [Streptomyces sp. NPDC058992]|uniref:hypothetical protein n=1 Tax=Streptomyces sp. NPDC058992 TaxID=3346688 RepID=UPI0036B57180
MTTASRRGFSFHSGRAHPGPAARAEGVPVHTADVPELAFRTEARTAFIGGWRVPR